MNSCANFLLITTVLFFGVQVSAATFELGRVDPNYPLQGLIISGEIKGGDYQRLIQLVRNDHLFLGRIVVLASPGGDLPEAIKIGNLIKATYRPVFVNSRVGKCASACFLIYVAAVQRNATYPSVGIHRPYFAPAYFENLSLSAAEATNKKMLNQVRAYLEDREVPQYLIEKMFSLSSDEIYWLTFEDLKRIGYRPNWYDQLMVDRCKLNKELEEGYNSYGPNYVRATEALEMIKQVALCAAKITDKEGNANLLKLIQGN